MFTKNMLSVEAANMQLLEFALLKEKEKVTVIKINAKETVTRLDILTLMFILDQIICPANMQLHSNCPGTTLLSQVCFTGRHWT